jgi:hypothetical protein
MGLTPGAAGARGRRRRPAPCPPYQTHARNGHDRRTGRLAHSRHSGRRRAKPVSRTEWDNRTRRSDEQNPDSDGSNLDGSPSTTDSGETPGISLSLSPSSDTVTKGLAAQLIVTVAATPGRSRGNSDGL